MDYVIHFKQRFLKKWRTSMTVIPEYIHVRHLIKYLFRSHGISVSVGNCRKNILSK